MGRNKFISLRKNDIACRPACDSILGLLFISLLFAILTGSCTNKSIGAGRSGTPAIDSLIPQYSHSFRVDYYNGYHTVTVYDRAAEVVNTYVLYSDNTAIPAGYRDAIRIPLPARHVVCMSTTHVGAMKLLGARDLIAAASNKSLIYDSTVRSMMDRGIIKDAGPDYQPDYETIVQVHPDIVFADGENTGSSQLFAKLKALHMTAVISRDYFEQGPLARAEWIKFFAAFIGKEKLADSIFDEVKASYLSETEKYADADHKPTVFCNLPYNGVWYMPCGENYVARLIEDAGGDFLWNKDKPMNGFNLTLNFEQVYERAVSADIWLNTGTLTSVAQIIAQDAKFKMFQAYKTGNIYNCTRNMTAGSGMDIWETGTFRPDTVLNDLAEIFHPGRSTDTIFHYYTRLK